MNLKQKQITGMAGYGWKWLEITGHGFEWNGRITVLGIWGVWDMKIGGLGDFQFCQAQPGVLV